VKKPDVIQKNELYFCNQGSNVIQNQLSKSKHRLKSFVLQACVIIKCGDHVRVCAKNNIFVLLHVVLSFKLGTLRIINIIIRVRRIL
jgi:hypothetical protein